MKSFLAFLKSPVGKLHSVISVFILFNLLSGLVNLFIHHTAWLVGIHFYTGLLIVIAPLAFLLASPNRRIAFTALAKMAMPNRADFRKGKPAKLLFKIITLLIVLLTCINALSGIAMKLQFLTIASYNIHVFDFRAMLFLVPLHAALAAAIRAKRVKKPIGAQRTDHGSNLKV